MVSYCEPTAAEDLHLEDHLLGEGWSGCIARGTYNGRPVAVKLAIVGSDVAEVSLLSLGGVHLLEISGCLFFSCVHRLSLMR